MKFRSLELNATTVTNKGSVWVRILNLNSSPSISIFE
jgi:hypothetical protein